MKKSILALAAFVASTAVGAILPTSASARTFDISITDRTLFGVTGVGTITGQITVVGDNVTAFTGTASGFGYGGLFDGPVTLGQNSGGPAFTVDDKWVGGTYGVDGEGIGLTNGKYNFRLYDYYDSNNNYGNQLGYFAASGFNPVNVSPVPELSTWAMLLAGFGALSFAGRRRSQGAALRA